MQITVPGIQGSDSQEGVCLNIHVSDMSYSDYKSKTTARYEILARDAFFPFRDDGID